MKTLRILLLAAFAVACRTSLAPPQPQFVAHVQDPIFGAWYTSEHRTSWVVRVAADGTVAEGTCEPGDSHWTRHEGRLAPDELALLKAELAQASTMPESVGDSPVFWLELFGSGKPRVVMLAANKGYDCDYVGRFLRLWVRGWGALPVKPRRQPFPSCVGKVHA